MEEGNLPKLESEDYQHLTDEFLTRFRDMLLDLDPPDAQFRNYQPFLLACLDSIDVFIGQIQQYLTKEDTELVIEALLMAFKAHGLVVRKSNDALFFMHPLAASQYLADFRLDAPTLAATLLHDVAEDTTVSISEVFNKFGPEVGHLVQGVTKLQATGKAVSLTPGMVEPAVETENRLYQFMLDDVRVVLVKLADRLHNMRTLDALIEKKKQEKAREVLTVYAPLAYRLGMWDVKSELEELAFATINPRRHQVFQNLINQREQGQKMWLDIGCNTILKDLAQEGITALVEHAPEHIYTLYQDYMLAQREPTRLADVIRVAVLLQTEDECYRALGVIHDRWQPVPGTFDDYIARPRDNLYQSLHTTVFGPGGRLLKIRIRTMEMHEIARHGILARWSIDVSQQAKPFEGIQRLINRLRPVGLIDEHEPRSAAFREALSDQIQVFTPDGELVELPKKATPLDFAYQIHSKLGDEARIAWINGIQQPLNHTLQNGDQVNIERKPGALPMREWLDHDLGFATTMYARSRIRQTFRRLKGRDAVQVGRDAVTAELEMMGVPDADVSALAPALGFEKEEDLLLAVARAQITPQKVAIEAFRPVWERLGKTSVGGESIQPDATVNVRALPGRPVRLCGSCKPKPGDNIVGNLLRGGQVTVHRMDCHHLSKSVNGTQQLDLVPLDWTSKPRQVRTVFIRVAASDEQGVTSSLAEILKLKQVNIQEIYGRSDQTYKAGLLTLTADVNSMKQLSRVLHRCQQLPAVITVQRTDDSPHFDQDAMQWAIAKVSSL
ncbi:MAG: RelA/SpoT family protein [Chloroflexota bacterium]